MCARGDPVTRKRRSNRRLSKNFKGPHLSTQASEDYINVGTRPIDAYPGGARSPGRSVGFACTSLPSAKSKPPTKNRDKKRSNQPTADYEEKKAVERHLQGCRGGGVVVVSFRGGSSLGSGSKARRLEAKSPGSGSARARSPGS